MLEGLFVLDRAKALPLPDQIYRGVRGAIADGRLARGARLPSSRGLAVLLGVSRNTVNAAYELLAAEGVIQVRPGAAPRVIDEAGEDGAAARGGVEKTAGTAGAAAGRRERRGEGASPPPVAVRLSQRGAMLDRDPWAATGRRRGGRLEPGTPALDCFPRDAWGRALRRAARQLRGGELFYDQLAGHDPLRRSLARYLVEERGVRATAERVMVLPSTQACLFLLASVLADAGDVAWVEDPGYLGARAAFLAAGLSLRPMPVDALGADPRAMAASPPPRLIYVTPSHQYPFGMLMPLERRLAVLESARATGAVVIEDDYDSEFLFSGRPLAALQGLGREGETVYLGTFSKALLPGVRVAYMVVPEPLAAPLARAQRATGALASVATQAALAEFLETGHYRAHLRRIRGIYQERGLRFAAALRRHLGAQAEIADPVGGVQLAIRLLAPVDDRAVAARVNAVGFSAAALSAYALDAPVRGLVIGFAAADAAEAEACARAIGAAVAAEGAAKNASPAGQRA